MTILKRSESFHKNAKRFLRGPALILILTTFLLHHRINRILFSTRALVGCIIEKEKSSSSLQQLKKAVLLVGANDNNNTTIPCHECILQAGTTTLARTRVNYLFPKARLEQSMHVIAGVLSSSLSDKLRQSIRDTWARNLSNVFFLVAGNLTDALRDEMETKQDVIWFDTAESYHNLTYKSLGFFHVVRQHAHQDYQFVFKTDDDTYINMEKLENTLQKHKKDDYFGYCKENSPIIRKPSHRWYVSEEAYPRRNDNDTYRVYAMGGGYGISKRTLEKECVGINIANISYVPIEDATTGEILGRCHAECTRNKIMEKFSFRFMGSTRKSFSNVALYEIKHPEIMNIQHVEFCLDHPNAKSCQGFDVSCADPIRRSVTCKVPFVGCGGKKIADSCSQCPEMDPIHQTVDHSTCKSQCHWCPMMADNKDFFALPETEKRKYYVPEQCVPRGTVCGNFTSKLFTEKMK